MADHSEDPKGYYATLRISPRASAEEVKRAYRRRAFETHPDKNPGRDTRGEFQRVAEAYAVLSDPIRRALYDNSARQMPSGEQSAQTSELAEPIRCSVCNDLTAQPRYVIFLQVVSAIVFTRRSGVQGVYCARCALKRGVRASAVTWIAGWWGFPWGLIYSCEALARNLTGGIRPAEVNAKLLGHQAWAFARRGQTELARSIAADAMTFAVKAKDHAQVSALGEFLNRTQFAGPIRSLRSRWNFINPALGAQATLAAVVIGSLYGWILFDKAETVRDWERLTAKRAIAHASVPAPAVVASQPLTPVSSVPLLQQVPVPQNAEYTPYWTPTSEAVAPFEVVTRGAGLHHFIKLSDWETGTPVVTLFVRSGETAEIRVPLGSYRLKYAAGSDWYGEDALFGPNTDFGEAEARFDFTQSGNRYSGHTVTLALTPNGNLRHRAIRPTDF